MVDHFDRWNSWQDWYENGNRGIEAGELIAELNAHQNQGIILKGDNAEAYGIVKGDRIVPIKEYYPEGLKPRNIEQKIALSLLADETIPQATEGP